MSENKTIFLCAISNIESGTCNEDCKFCTQSVRYKADIERYKRKEIEQIVADAKQAKANQANGFCLVTAGKGLTKKRLAFVCEAIRAVKKENLGLILIACNGTANIEQLEALKEAGADAYNHNLETSRDFYPEIVTTHTWDERYETCQNVNKVGLRLVCGGIFGLGETQEQRISMLESIASLNPRNVPINFFHPNKALPLVENSVTREEAFKLIELTRKMVPNAEKIMAAGGRELMFGDEQYKVFDHGVNAVVVGNYLTTKGKSAYEDIKSIEDLGFKIINECMAKA